jgi:hypothetical protein
LIILIQIATALAIGAYVVLSKDAQPKCPDATSRESCFHGGPRNYRDAEDQSRHSPYARVSKLVIEVAVAVASNAV